MAAFQEAMLEAAGVLDWNERGDKAEDWDLDPERLEEFDACELFNGIDSYEGIEYDYPDFQRDSDYAKFFDSRCEWRCPSILEVAETTRPLLGPAIEPVDLSETPPRSPKALSISDADTVVAASGASFSQESRAATVVDVGTSPAVGLQGAHAACHLLDSPPAERKEPPIPSSSRKRQHSPDHHGSTDREKRKRPMTGVLVIGTLEHHRRKLTEEERQNAAYNRQYGACYRCKLQKQKCVRTSPYAPCQRCLAQKKAYKIKILPCCQNAITDGQLFRKRPHVNSPLDQNRAAIFDLDEMALARNATRKVTILHRLGVRFDVSVAQFLPENGDRLSYSWASPDGRRSRLDLPPYCLTDIEAITKHMWTYAQTLYRQQTFITELIFCDPLVGATILKAVEFASKNKNGLVDKALFLWSSTRLIEGQRSLGGADTLGIPLVLDPNAPQFGCVPVIPIIDTQLDQIIIQGVLEPVCQELLQALQQEVNNRNPEKYAEVYFTMFILLCCIARNAEAQENFARRYNLATRFSNPRLLESYFHTARILIAHFQYVCKGNVAFQSDWTSPKVIKFAKLSPEDAHFFEQSKRMANDRKSELTQLRHTKQYHKPLMWSHQLFYPDWSPEGPLHVDDIFI